MRDAIIPPSRCRKREGCAMIVAKVWSGAIALLAVTLLGMATTTSGHADDSWQAVLRLQLEADQRCQLDHMISVRELPVAQLGALEGRLRCKDGREFDFSRVKPHLKFELRLCAPAVC